MVKANDLGDSIGESSSQKPPILIRHTLKDIRSICESITSNKGRHPIPRASELLGVGVWNHMSAFAYPEIAVEAADVLEGVRIIRKKLPSQQREILEDIYASRVYGSFSKLSDALRNSPNAADAKKIISAVIATGAYLRASYLGDLYIFVEGNAHHLGIRRISKEKLYQTMGDIISKDVLDENGSVDYQYLYSLANFYLENYSKHVREIGQSILMGGVEKAKDSRESLKHFYDREIEKAGLNPRKAITAWRKTTSTTDVRQNEFRFSGDGAVNYNFVAMQILEQKQKGICKILAEEFNIYDFARYPQHILLDMVANRNILDIPYVTLVMPRSDWNCAFYQEKHLPIPKPLLGSIYSQLKQYGFALRIIEADGKKNLLSLLNGFKEKYEKRGNQKISALFLFGHGDEGSLQLNGDENGTMRNSDDYLCADDFDNITPYGVSDLPIVLGSCSNGIEGGMAEKASRRTRAAIRASAIVGNTQYVDIGYFRSSKRLWFDVRYSKNDAHRLHYDVKS